MAAHAPPSGGGEVKVLWIKTLTGNKVFKTSPKILEWILLLNATFFLTLLLYDPKWFQELKKNQSSWLDRVGAVKFTQLFHGKITSGLQDLQIIK